MRLSSSVSRNRRWNSTRASNRRPRSISSMDDRTATRHSPSVCSQVRVDNGVQAAASPASCCVSTKAAGPSTLAHTTPLADESMAPSPTSSGSPGWSSVSGRRCSGTSSAMAREIFSSHASTRPGSRSSRAWSQGPRFAQCNTVSGTTLALSRSRPLSAGAAPKSSSPDPARNRCLSGAACRPPSVCATNTSTLPRSTSQTPSSRSRSTGSAPWPAYGAPAARKHSTSLARSCPEVPSTGRSQATRRRPARGTGRLRPPSARRAGRDA